MSIYNLIEYRRNYSHTAGSLWQYYKDKLANPITNSAPFRFKSRLLDDTSNDSIINTEIAVPLKHLTTNYILLIVINNSNFWRTIAMLLINCEINLILISSEDCVISELDRATVFATADTRFYVPFVTL